MYKSWSLFVAALAASSAYAQTPQGFKPAANQKLDVVFNSTAVKTPGELLTKATTASAPELAVSGRMAGNASATFMFVMLDLDVPGQQGSQQRRVLLHALETGFKASQKKINGSATVLASTQKGPAAYLPPGPPATDTMPHRYVQLLFEQPAQLNVKASDFANTTARIGFDINKFMAEHKLQEPLAGNFFRVDGRANGTAGRPSPSGSGRGSKPTTEPFRGAAGHVEVTHGLVPLFAILALFAM